MSNDPKYKVIKAYKEKSLRKKKSEITNWLRVLEATNTRRVNNMRETKNYWIDRLNTVNQKISLIENRSI
jgi:predicted RNase H-like nuclease